MYLTIETKIQLNPEGNADIFSHPYTIGVISSTYAITPAHGCTLSFPIEL